MPPSPPWMIKLRLTAVGNRFSGAISCRRLWPSRSRPIILRAGLRGATSPRDCLMAPDLEQHEPTVLIIEDDESVATAMTCLLTREGYLVMTAATGHDALGMLRRPLSPIDVVILDVHLPDVSGISLCTRLREFYPKLP